MSPSPLTLSILPDRLAICRLAPDAPIPPWACTAAFGSITRTPDELSIVCAEAAVPTEVTAERAWKGLKVHGPIAFTQTGLLASLAQPLAAAGVSLFAISTYDTDYVLVKENTLETAVATLRAQGHHVL